MADFTPGNEGKSRMYLPGGLTIPGIAAIAAIVLSVVGLAGVEPVLLMSIAAVFLGFAFLMGFGYAGTLSTLEAEETAGGIGFDSLAGLAGIVLGILSLIGVSPQILLPSAAIAFGCAMLLESASAGAPGQVPTSEQLDVGSWSPRGSTFASSGVALLCGTAAVVLGILALTGYSPAVLTFVAFLTTGCAHLLIGTALTRKSTASLHRRF